MPETQNNVPDLYGLLKLAPLENDTKVIRQALAKLKKQVEAAQASGDSSNAKRGAKLLKLAKHHLLDGTRKPKFDQKWAAAYGNKQTPEEESNWNCEALLPFLPEGDPYTEFNLAEFLESEEDYPQTNLDEEFDRLINLLEDEDSGQIAAASAAVVQAIPARPVVAAQPVSQHSFQSPPSAAPSQIAKKMRRKRNNSTLFLAIGGALSLVATIALILFVLQNGKRSDAPSDAPLANANNPDNKPKQRKTAPQGSGLPKVGESDNDENLEPGLPLGGPMDDASDPFGVPMNDDMNNMPDRTPDNPPDTMVPNMEPPATTAPPVTKPPVQLTADERKAWQQDMVSIASSLSAQNYSEAVELLAKATPRARAEEQKAQLSRISMAVTLAEEFQSAMIEAIQDFDPGESFVVGNQTEISFVGADTQSVTFKIFGRNQTYRLTDLRMGIAQALAKFKMDLTHPNSKAMQASFMRFHSAVPDQEVARGLMLEAITAGVVDANMEELFDDQYE